ncbi:MAG: hypothetical protein ACRDTA_26535 [Pseudonocardiaceae bacterium]
MPHGDQFTTTGPAFTGAGVPRAGFSTKRVADRTQDFVDGANVQGQRCGLYADSVAARGDVSERFSSHEGVGVHGVGDNFGVFGDGNVGIAGVFGRHNRGGAGVVGAVMRGGTGVIGASMSSLGNEIANFRPLPTTADGEGTGVLGLSGMGAGIQGSSDTGNGVVGSIGTGAGVRGSGGNGPGGVFESRSGHRFACCRDIASPEGRVKGQGGELFVTTGTSASGRPLFSLWFCIEGGGTASAVWELMPADIRSPDL